MNELIVELIIYASAVMLAVCTLGLIASITEHKQKPWRVNRRGA